ncbi:radial spoke head protein 9 homolog [Xenia sp. Carnegie-2017]|uniref:radial spoke head protein 9 homolog n=1 Tax=Xenia sp. Carnegie-2017 TaxID=2897299 RepID=UPI001F038C42|nr:radial spoke head protein 9 homolog [Xenia sp. Carnegie-2017]
MEADALHLNIDYVGSSGVILSTEQKAAFQSSLVILKSNYKYKKVFFWGKVLGVRDDYFIVEGIGKDEMTDRHLLYSVDCVKWGLLPHVTEQMKANCAFVKGRFTGDPSYEYEHTETKRNEEKETDADLEEEKTVLVKEEDRLATVIAAINYDVAIVPRGSFLRSADGNIYSNRSFEGLTMADAAKLCSYFHFREPILLNQKSLLQKASLDKSIDFLDPIDADVPNGGSWSIQYEKGCGLVTLRSLHWLGFVFYHVPETRKFGRIYVGTGEKNLDLPFML